MAGSWGGSFPLACMLAASCAGGGGAPPARDPPDTRQSTTDEASRATCGAVMRRTRACEDVWLPGLFALRVRLDLPQGIAAKLKAVGQEAMLAQARQEFAADWSEAAIEKNCSDLLTKPAADQQRILAEASECLAKPDCQSFASCDLAQKERRWTANPAKAVENANR